MDPVSAAASIAGLYQVVDLLVGRLSTYVTGVYGARKEIEDLTKSVTGLSGILQRLRDLAFQTQEETRGAGLTGSVVINEAHITTCRDTVKRLQSILERHDPLQAANSFGGIVRKLKWPLQAPQTRSITSELERHKATITLELLNYNADGVRRLINSQGKVSDRVGLLTAQHEERVEIEERQAMRDNNRRILQFLGENDYESTQSSILATRYKNTGTWFTDGPAFQEWYGGARRKLWLYGIPGAGKTVLTSWVVHYIQLASRKAQSKDGLAFFYCSYQHIDTHEPRTILSAIIRQFAEQNVASMAELRRFHQDHYPEGKSSLTPSIDDLCQLVRFMSEQFDNARIVVDALDEIGEKKRGQVVDLLGNLVGAEGSELKILLTSRDEIDIRKAVNSFKYQAVNIEAKDTDLRLYVEFELNKRISTGVLELYEPTLKDSILQRLSTEAGGMFRWVVCQMDFLCDLPDDESRRDALHSLPPNLRDSYERILDRVEKQPAYSQKITKTVLQWLVSIRHPMSLAALAEALAVQHCDRVLQRNKIPTVHTIAKLCSSFVRISEDFSTIELAHFSVREFLVDLTEAESAYPSKYATYGTKAEDGELEIAKTLLTYLCLDDFGGECPENRQAHKEREEHYPLRSFAVSRWARYACGNYGDLELMALAKRFFKPFKSFQLVSWSQDLLLQNSVDEDVEDMEEDRYDYVISRGNDVSVIHWACFLGIPSISHWLIQNGCDINKKSSLLGTPLLCAVCGPRVLENSREPLPDNSNGSLYEMLRQEVVRMLLDAEADTDIEMYLPRMRISTTALHEALMNRDFENGRLLLVHGALFTRRCIQLMEDLMEDETDCSEFERLVSAISPANIRSEDSARTLDIVARCRSSQTGDFCKIASSSVDISKLQASLRTAARNGMEDLVKELVVKLDGDIDAPEDCTQLTALHLAAENGSSENVRTLLKWNADVHQTNSEGGTPLHVAIEAEQPEIVSILLAAKSSIKAATTGGMTAVHLAAQSCNTTVLGLLKPFIETERFNMATPDKNGYTPLLLGARNPSLPIVEYILKTFPEAHLNDADHEGHGCLHFAMSIYSVEHIKYFLERGLGAHHTTKDGSTLLHLAAALPHTVDDIMQLFIRDQGLDPSQPRHDGATPIHFLCLYPRYERRDSLSKLLTFCPLDGIAVNAIWTSHNGHTPLHCLVHKSCIHSADVHMIELLCNRPDIDINARSESGSTPWVDLIRRMSRDDLSYFESIEMALRAVKLFLLRKDTVLDGLDLQASLECLCTVVPENIGVWALDLLRLLVIRGANINAKNEKGDSAFTLLLAQLGKAVHVTESPNVAAQLTLTTEAEAYSAMIHEALEHASEDEVLDARYLGYQVLSVAIAAREEHLIQKVLERPVDVDKSDDLDRLTPFERACVWGCGSSLAEELARRSSKVTQLGSQGDSPLYIASFCGSKEMVSALLAHKADPNSKTDRFGEVPIHRAAGGGHLEILKMLIEGGADLNMTDANGWNTVAFAASRGRKNVLTYLLGMSIAFNVTCTGDYFLYSNGDLGDYTALHIAAANGHADTVTLLLSSGYFPQIDIRGTESYFTSLYIAAFSGHATTVARLLDFGADHTLSETSKGWTPLHAAAAGGFYSVVRLLLDGGADCRNRDRDNATPELLALSGGHIKVSELLRNCGQEQKTTQSDGGLEEVNRSSLLLDGLAAAIERDDFDGCTRLIDCGVDLAAPLPNCEPCTAIIRALQWQRFKIASLLVERGSPVDVSTCAKHVEKNYNPVHYAASSGHLPTLTLLLERTRENLSEYPVSPLHLATAGGNLECMKLLLDYQAPRKKESVDGQQHTRVSKAADVATESASISGNRPGNGVISGHSLIRSCVTSEGEDWTWEVREEGSQDMSRTVSSVPGTALHIAAYHNQQGAANLLLDREADIDSEDASCNTPLHAACRIAPTDMIELLIGRGANINCREVSGKTPVIIAAECGRLDVLQTLRAHGADFTCSSADNSNALLFAARRDHNLVLELLLDSGCDPTQYDSWGYNALPEAITWGSESSANFFLDRRTCPYVSTTDGSNVVNLASQEASLAIMKRILGDLGDNERRRMIDNKSTSYGTPLYSASCRGRLDIANLLIDNGATIDLAGGNLGSPLLAACTMGRLEVVQLLVERGAQLEYFEYGKAPVSAYEAARHHKKVQEWLTAYMKRTMPPEAAGTVADVKVSSTEEEAMSTTSSAARSLSAEASTTNPDSFREAALDEESSVSLIKPNVQESCHPSAPEAGGLLLAV